MKPPTIRPYAYDGMVSVTADGSMRFRTYEPRWWQVGRRLRWLWWKLASRFNTSIALAEITITVNGTEQLNLRVVAEPEPSPRRH